jgi:hypothetical protein
MSMALFKATPVNATRNWNLTITVDNVKLLKAVDPWPGDKHGEIFYLYRVIGYTGAFGIGFEQWRKEAETSPRSLEVGKSYFGGRYTFFGLTDRYSMALRMEVWDDDIGMTDDYLIGYPNIGKNHRSAIFIWDIKYVQIFPGQSATFEVSNSIIQVRFVITWS